MESIKICRIGSADDEWIEMKVFWFKAYPILGSAEDDSSPEKDLKMWN